MEKNKSTTELIIALEQMLSENSVRFTAEELITLTEIKDKLRYLIDFGEKTIYQKEINLEIKKELLKLSFSLIRLLFEPEVIKSICDVIR